MKLGAVALGGEQRTHFKVGEHRDGEGTETCPSNHRISHAAGPYRRPSRRHVVMDEVAGESECVSQEEDQQGDKADPHGRPTQPGKGTV